MPVVSKHLSQRNIHLLRVSWPPYAVIVSYEREADEIEVLKAVAQELSLAQSTHAAPHAVSHPAAQAPQALFAFGPPAAAPT